MRWLNQAIFLAVVMTAMAACLSAEAQYEYPPYGGEQKPASEKRGGPRTQHWSGFDVALGMPFPSIAGGLIGFNIGDDARISGGAGTFGKWTTYQLDTKFFLGVSNWVGYIGGGLDYMIGEGRKYYIWDLGFTHAWVPYIQTGVDYQADSGFHLTINLAGSAPGGEILILPGLAVGWYF